MKNLTYVDKVKGIGIIAVVMLHSGLTSPFMAACISAFIMPLFFVTSGILLQHTQAANKTRSVFYGKRAHTLLVPYVVFSVLYLIMGALRGYTTPELFGIFFETVTLFGNSVLWFLPCLFLAQAIVYEVYQRVNYKKSLPIIIAISVFGYVFIKWLILSFPKDTLWWQGVYYFLFAVGRALFSVGFVGIGYGFHVWVEQIEQLLNKKCTKWVKMLLAGLLCMLSLGVWILLARKNGPTDFKVMSFGNLTYYLVAATAAILGMSIVCKAMVNEKVLAYFGRYSLIIMLTHLDLQFLNVAIKCGELLQSCTGSVGGLFYWFGIIGSMILLEIITIYICNYYVAFLFGKRNLCKVKK